ncbi:MAG TPA: hypothetical protein VGH28_17670 [Polyangiaceae bacterium]|jgi:hypothetical protein
MRGTSASSFRLIGVALVACVACKGGKPRTTAQADASAAAPLDAAADGDADAESAEDADVDATDASIVREAGPGPFGFYRGEHAAAAVEREGGAIRVLFAKDAEISAGGITNRPTELVGRTAPNGTFHAAAFGKVTLDGSIDAVGHLTGTFKLDGEETAVDIQQQSPFSAYEITFSSGPLAGVVGDVHVRSKWVRDHGKLSATTITIRGEKHTLDGTVDEKWGTFRLAEKDSTGAPSGRWTGVFLTSGDVLARWTSPDGTTTRPITLRSATMSFDYPPVVTLQGGGTMAPIESYWAIPFYASASVMPMFSGLASSSAEATLNAWSKQRMARPSKTPDTSSAISAWDETSYAFAAERPGWVALDVRTYGYTAGGTHGFAATECYVLDLASGARTSLVRELPSAGRTALAALVRKTIASDPSRTKGEDLSYVKIGDGRALCVLEKNGALFLDVVFDEADGFYVMAPEVHLAASAVRSLFPAGSMGARVFQ